MIISNIFIIPDSDSISYLFLGFFLLPFLSLACLPSPLLLFLLLHFSSISLKLLHADYEKKKKKKQKTEKPVASK